jgi:hypothetical protein
MADNALRCIESDYPTLLAMAEMLGAITIADGEAIGCQGCTWDYIGYKVLADESILADGSGNKYVHVNVRTPFSVGEAAATLAAGSPEIAAALSQIGRFFITDVGGNPIIPEFPMRVFL